MRWMVVVLCIVSCSSSKSSLVLELPSDGNLVPGQVVELYAPSATFAPGGTRASIGGMALSVSTIDPHHAGFLVPQLQPGKATLDVSGFTVVQLTIGTLQAPSDPVSFVNQEMQAIQTRLSALQAQAPQISAYTTDATNRLAQFQQMFASASAADQQTVATMLAANSALFSGSGVSARSRLTWDQWTMAATTYWVDYALCGAAILLTVAAIPEGPLAVAGALVALSTTYAQVNADNQQILNDNIVVPINDITMGLGSAGRIAPATAGSLVFQNGASTSLDVQATFVPVTTADEDSPNEDIRRVAQAEAGLPTAITNVNAEIAPPLPAPPDDSSAPGMTRAFLTSEITVSADNNVAVALSSASAQPAAITASVANCNGSSSISFALTVNYVAVPSLTSSQTFSAEVDCTSNGGGW